MGHLIILARESQVVNLLDEKMLLPLGVGRLYSLRPSASYDLYSNCQNQSYTQILQAAFSDWLLKILGYLLHPNLADLRRPLRNSINRRLSSIQMSACLYIRLIRMRLISI